MSNKTKITGIRLNGWGILALVIIVFFFWEPLLIIGGILAVGWLIYRNWTKFSASGTKSPKKTEARPLQ